MSAEELRQICLHSGVAGIKKFCQHFRKSEDGSRKLTAENFHQSLLEANIQWSEEKSAQLFKSLDTEDTGTIDFEELLTVLRPPMSANRIKLVTTVYETLCKDVDCEATVEDLSQHLNIAKNPNYQNGVWTKKQVVEKFLEHFGFNFAYDTKFNFEDFLNFYSGISAQFTRDVEFDFLLRQTWKFI